VAGWREWATSQVEAIESWLKAWFDRQVSRVLDGELRCHQVAEVVELMGIAGMDPAPYLKAMIDENGARASALIAGLVEYNYVELLRSGWPEAWVGYWKNYDCPTLEVAQSFISVIISEPMRKLLEDSFFAHEGKPGYAAEFFSAAHEDAEHCVQFAMNHPDCPLAAAKAGFKSIAEP